MTTLTPQKDTGTRDIAIALVAAAVLRLLHLALLPRVIDMADAIHYITMAKQFAAGEFTSFDENLPVLYSALGALAHLVIDDWERAFYAVSLTASTLLVWPVYRVSARMHGEGAARISALLVCVWPWLLDYAGRITPDALAVTLWFAAIVCLYRLIDDGRWWMVLAPVTLFLLHLARPEGTFLMLGAPIFALPLVWGRPANSWRNLGVAMLVGAVLIAAYAYVMDVLIGTATVSYRAPMAGDVDDYFRRGAVEGARTFMQLFFGELPVMLGPALLAFFGIGFFMGGEPKRRFRLEVTVILFCLAQWAMTLANFSPAPRYMMATIVALSLWSARGTIVAAYESARQPLGPLLQLVPVLLVIGLFGIGIARDFVSEYSGGMPALPREYKIAGHWMRDTLEPGVIISRKPQIGFYADMPSTGPAETDDPAAVIERARTIGARYLVLDERYTTSIVPGLKGLLDPATAPSGLRLIREDLSPYEGAKVVVYEFTGIAYTAPEDFGTPSSHMGPDERRRKTDTP